MSETTNQGRQDSLRRGLGAPALFGIVQSVIAASIYFSLGLVGSRGLGFTWMIYVGAFLFFGLLVLSYVEGVSLHAERGGATVLARYAFNELISFIAGWAICLDYLILIAITALVATNYASTFLPPLSGGAPEILVSCALIIFFATVHILGSGARRYDKAALIMLGDLALQILIVVLGVAYLLNPEILTDPVAIADSPSFQDTMFAFTIAIAAFSALDASSGLAGQVRVGRKGLRRLITARMFAAAVPYIGIAAIGTSVLPFSADVAETPVLGIVDAFPQSWLREVLLYVVSAAAIAVLLVACNAAMLGLSRLGHSLALNRQIPAVIGRLHSRFSTPYIVIAAGATLSLSLVIPGNLEFLAAIYAFGATLAFTLVHLSVVVLRAREPQRDRPYKMPLNIKFKGVDWPVPAIFGALLSALAFGSVLAVHTGARIVGVVWMLLGICLYLIYRTAEDKPVLRRILVPESALHRPEEDAGEYSTILVPILGNELDDDIMQTAGRLSGVHDEEEREAGAQIEAMWTIVVPLSKPLDAPLPEEEIKVARKALARAKAVGEEYEGVTVSTNIMRARNIGQAIVSEAHRKGVEAIVLAAEAPTRMRGGVSLGGKEGLFDTFVGETTKYVISKAPCRVILTAPPEVLTSR